jgi:hypothetical protein
MVIQFTLMQLMVFLLSVIGAATGIILFLTLLKAKKAVGSLHSLLENNKEAINKAIKTLPETFENAGEISSGLKETTDKIKISMPMIMADAAYVTSTVKNDMSGRKDVTRAASGFMIYFHAIESVLNIIARIISTKKS